jgi:hypothetical protein
MSSLHTCDTPVLALLQGRKCCAIWTACQLIAYVQHVSEMWLVYVEGAPLDVPRGALKPHEHHCLGSHRERLTLIIDFANSNLDRKIHFQWGGEERGEAFLLPNTYGESLFPLSALLSVHPHHRSVGYLMRSLGAAAFT